ncbi:MAG: class I SAM-dependent methyltransferase [bacterium]|nr:class I SAM-dependent methyltransferase [bacterium]
MSFTIGTDFDRATNWQARLDRELPFLRAWLRSWNAREALDMACGSGRHCLGLAAMGFRMTGVDRDPAMLETAHALAAPARAGDDGWLSLAPGACRFLLGDLLEPPDLEAQDGVLCLGNSLCLLASQEEAGRALAAFRDRLARRGGLLIHVLNYQRFRNPAQAFFPLKTDFVDGRPLRHFLKMIEVKDAVARVHLVRIEEDGPGRWIRQVKSDRLLALDAGPLQELVLAAGFGEVQVYGSLKGELYHADSHDLVLCARRM